MNGNKTAGQAAKKTAKDKVAAKQAAAATVQMRCTVLKNNFERGEGAGAVVIAAGTPILLESAKAKAAEELGHVRIDGVA